MAEHIPILMDSAVHGIIQCAAGNEWNHRRYAYHSCRCFQNSGQNLCINLAKRTSYHIGDQHIKTKDFLTKQIHPPGKKSAQGCRNQKPPIHIEDQRKPQRTKRCCHKLHNIGFHSLPRKQNDSGHDARSQGSSPQQAVCQFHDTGDSIADQSVSDSIRYCDSWDQQHDNANIDLIDI